MQTKTEDIKHIGIVGARALPNSYEEKIRGIVKYLLNKGYGIASGGATGTDTFALNALLHFGQCPQGIIFSTWKHIAQFPAIAKEPIKRFIDEGGRVSWGFVPFNACRNAVVAGLLGRNIKLASEVVGLAAFLHGESRGTTFTISQAAKRNIPIVAFLCGANAALPILSQGHWVALKQQKWKGAYKVIYPIPN